MFRSSVVLVAAILALCSVSLSASIVFKEENGMRRGEVGGGLAVLKRRALTEIGGGVRQSDDDWAENDGEEGEEGAVIDAKEGEGATDDSALGDDSESENDDNFEEDSALDGVSGEGDDPDDAGNTALDGESMEGEGADDEAAMDPDDETETDEGAEEEVAGEEVEEKEGDETTLSGLGAEGESKTDASEGDSPVVPDDEENTVTEDSEESAANDDGDATTLTGEGEGETEDEKEDDNGSPADGHVIPESSDSMNETAAFQSFTLLQMEEVDDNFRMVPIFSNESLVGPWANSPTISNFDELEVDIDDREWYIDGVYADRISFQYTFTPESEYYAKFSPVMRVLESSTGINPILMDEEYDMEGGVGQFSFKYQCQVDGQERTRIALHLQVTDSHAVDTMWVKVCGHGRFDRIEFGYVNGENSIVEFNADGTYGTDEKHILEVGPTQLSTVLSAQLRDPAWQLDFEDPEVVSDSELVTVSLRDTVMGGMFSIDFERRFSILYSCEKNSARANIRFSVAIPPWENITVTWRKVCGGTNSQGLLIGTTGTGSYEVMQDGELNAEYNVTEETRLEQAYSNIAEIDGKTNSKQFYVQNSEDAAELYIQTIAMTMSNPEVVRIVIETPFSAYGKYIGPSGAIIRRSETMILKLHFVCRRRGESLVMVTLPIQKFKNVEFGFIKHCLEPTVYQESGFLSTAGSLLGAVFVLSICGGGAFWYHMRRRSSTKYSAVPTNDRIP